MNIYQKLLNIQNSLKAPKNQFNKFGNYSYRSAEDILEGVKPILAENKTTLVIDDMIIQVGDRYYVEATAKLINTEKPDEMVQATAYAREDERKKGMDLSQLTGSTSSYARKYALNGLLAIDDTKDSDATNKHGKEQKTKQQPKKSSKYITDKQRKRMFAIAEGDAELVKDAIEEFGFTGTDEITKAKYNDICKYIEETKDLPDVFK